eukprot:m.57364 g.57364  ORF g.57364 m.57364 type:complete len:100 (-) comp13074_c1_seq3:155-454(-)
MGWPNLSLRLRRSGYEDVESTPQKSMSSTSSTTSSTQASPQHLYSVSSSSTTSCSSSPDPSDKAEGQPMSKKVLSTFNFGDNTMSKRLKAGHQRGYGTF